MAKKLNQNAHRLSLEWSRVEPAPGEWDEREFHHYYDVLRFLKTQGFQTFVTLHHFTNPLWLDKIGGWANREAVNHFANYVAKVCTELGEFIDFWLTINEPNVYAELGYIEGTWPPFKKSLWHAYQVSKNMLRAHNRAYEMIHAYYPKARVGFAQNIAFNEPARRYRSMDRLLTRISDWFNIDYVYARTRSDFLGVNYYFHNRVKFSWRKFFDHAKPQGQLTDKGWEIYPYGLYGALLKIAKYRLPIYITENGIADAKDRQRGKFIVEHLRAVHRALRKGVPVKGYLYWSLLDNYEWPVKPGETGFEAKFGLVGVDFETQKRTVRKSARMFAKICKNNLLDSSLRAPEGRAAISSGLLRRPPRRTDSSQ